MKHQITLIGGQILPVYLGILERNPDCIHMLYSKDSKEQFTNLKKMFPNKKILSYQIDPFNYDEILNITSSIVFAETKDASYELNITGGTKIMAIACQQVFIDLKMPIFYINQRHSIFDINEKKNSLISSKVNIQTFLKLSGHDKYQSTSLSDFSSSEIELSEYILKMINSGWYWKVYSQMYKGDKFISHKQFNFVHNSYEVNWDGSVLEITNGTAKKTFNSANSLKIAFTGLWWEILIAKSVSKWRQAAEFRMNLKINSKTSDKQTKNEIDIVLNTGQNLIFIECKAGEVTQDDLNKIKSVAKLYGGIASRSILVARKNPDDTIIERCHELGIDIFSQESSQMSKATNKRIYKFTNLSDLPKRLDLLLTKMQL
jgi:hypothetical protein